MRTYFVPGSYGNIWRFICVHIFFTGIPFTIYIMLTYNVHIFIICCPYVIIIFFTGIHPPISTGFPTSETNDIFNDPKRPTRTPRCLSQGTTPQAPASPWASSNLVNQHPRFVGCTWAIKLDDGNLYIKTNAPHFIRCRLLFPFGNIWSWCLFRGFRLYWKILK